MRILFTTLAYPFPPTNGQRLRNWALLHALAEEGHDVSLISFAEPGELEGDHREAQRICRTLERIPLATEGNGHQAAHFNRLRALGSLLPYGAWRHRSEAMRAAIERRLAADSFDLVICDDVYNFQNLPAQKRVPVILNKHDITHVILRRYLEYEQNPLKLGYGWMEYAKLRRWEAHACVASAGVFACSPLDRDLMQEFSPGARLAVVPNVIDVTKFAPAKKDDGKTILYVGALDWFPNQDAVEFFGAKIFPKLRELTPEAVFRVVGRRPPEDLQRRFAGVSGIEFTGMVPEVRVELEKAAVCVVPLRIGSGTRLKILEAAAMGKPVVSTRIGAEGLNFQDRSEILLVDEPSEFAQAVASLLASPGQRSAIGLRARARVEREYSLAALRRAIREALANLAHENETSSKGAAEREHSLAEKVVR
jgi:glycosyltransferase involved in cell wall biosynthesis